MKTLPVIVSNRLQDLILNVLDENILNQKEFEYILTCINHAKMLIKNNPKIGKPTSKHNHKFVYEGITIGYEINENIIIITHLFGHGFYIQRDPSTW